eukprot:IDg21257t1
MGEVKKNMRPKYTSDEDRIIVLETSATKAYCNSSRTIELFDIVAQRLNASEHSRAKSNARSVRDRFYRLLKRWRAKDEKQRKCSGIDKVFTDVDVAMLDILEGIKDAEDEKLSVRLKEKEKKEKTKAVDAAILECASKLAKRARFAAHCASRWRNRKHNKAVERRCF